MKQKLAIARALLHEPSVLFLDEPTSGLDPEAAHVVREAIASLKGAGRAIVLATHNLAEAERLADRVAFVRGRILRVDSPARLRAAGAGQVVVVEMGHTLPATAVDDARMPGVRVLESAGGRVSFAVADVRRDTPLLVRNLAASGADILAVRPATPSLESVYFDVMGHAPERNGAPSCVVKRGRSCATASSSRRSPFRRSSSPGCRSRSHSPGRGRSRRTSSRRWRLPGRNGPPWRRLSCRPP
jgi:ABC-2 type transport system ATP-binding protein